MQQHLMGKDLRWCDCLLVVMSIPIKSGEFQDKLAVRGFGNFNSGLVFFQTPQIVSGSIRVFAETVAPRSGTAPVTGSETVIETKRERFDKSRPRLTWERVWRAGTAIKRIELSYETSGSRGPHLAPLSTPGNSYGWAIFYPKCHPFSAC